EGYSLGGRTERAEADGSCRPLWGNGQDGTLNSPVCFHPKCDDMHPEVEFALNVAHSCREVLSELCRDHRAGERSWDKQAVRTETRSASHETKRGWSFAGWGFAPDHAGLCAPDGRVVELTRQEARLLTVFLRAAGRTLSRDYLLDSLGEANRDVYDRAIDTLGSRLPQKLSDDARRPQFLVTRTG